MQAATGAGGPTVWARASRPPAPSLFTVRPPPSSSLALATPGASSLAVLLCVQITSLILPCVPFLSCRGRGCGEPCAQRPPCSTHSSSIFLLLSLFRLQEDSLSACPPPFRHPELLLAPSLCPSLSVSPLKGCLFLSFDFFFYQFFFF